ncbi:chemotaxis protein CheB [Primorskyibacter sp. S187A]|uniref:chemotaxis protein CheB n=1 Tax=Primorskyibacter sp. S187A TaxID=3415130 RepID=UPI003C7E4172
MTTTKKTSKPAKAAAAQAEDTSQDQLRFVGIAASAGGLEAVSLLAQNLPEHAGAVYVVAQHMSPTHKSVLTSLISRETRLPVKELEAETIPEPDTLYITPPNTDVIYHKGLLRLRKPNGHPASPKPSADRLFKSLAENCGESSVGIVLSGTGSDGRYGVQAIREAGGITIAQDPISAKYDGMPTSAIESGCIDLTLSPEQVGTHLEKIMARPRNLDAFRTVMDQPNPLGELFGILLARTRVDFADYKENTLNRRIARRMGALGIDDYEDYVDYCRTSVDEVDALHRDLLISVTRFFRDPEQFALLRDQLGEALDKRKSGPIRVWVVGCATGEEAYSIAITLAELLGGIDKLAKRNVQVFATDIDQNAVEIARRGIYPITAAQDIPNHLLHEYFIVSEGEVSVKPELRAVTLFSQHNVFQDPPFINVDLVSIRNVLIYFNLALQERVLSRLHYAMATGGLLFVGTSETVGEMGVYFENREGADKIFGKRRGISGELSVEPGSRVYSPRMSRRHTPDHEQVAQEAVKRAEMSLARVVAPNGLICTRNGNIIEILGDISPFIEIRAGMATSLNIKMLIEPLRSEAMSLLAVALRNEARREGRWHALNLPVGNRIQLQVYPFTHQAGGETQGLIAINSKFEDVPNLQSSDIEDNDQRAYVERIEQEIKSTQEALQQTIEELQTANEELQSANEELQSTNEEFQATNEELETSNEELQSTNEELLTVNEELQISAVERQALASELEAMMTTAPYAVALADQALVLRRMSKQALQLFGLSELPPTGVHLSQCNLPAGFPALAPIANTVLRLQEARRLPILSDGQYFTMVMAPVHDLHKKLIGLSITITQYDNEPLARMLEMMGAATGVARWTYNLDTEELFWSKEMFEIFGRDRSGKMPIWEDVMQLVHPEDRQSEQDAIDTLIRHGGTHSSETRMFGADGRIRTVFGSTTLVEDNFGQPVQLIGVMWDTAKQTEHAILMSHLQTVQAELGIGFFSIDVANNLTVWNSSMYDLLGYSSETFSPTSESLLLKLTGDTHDEISNLFHRAIESGTPFETTCFINAQPVGEARYILRVSTRKRDDGRVSHVYGSLLQARDASEQVAKK